MLGNGFLTSNNLTETEERCFLWGPLRDVIGRTISAVQGSGELVSDLVRELQFSRCELLLLEAGSSGTGTVREPRVWRNFAVGRRYQATTGEDTTD
jgi:hypothetical protein